MAKERGFHLSHADSYEINWPGTEVAKCRMVGSHLTMQEDWMAVRAL